MPSMSSADMLGDAAGLAGGDVGMADIVQKGGLAVVDVTHDGDDGRPGLQVFLFILDPGVAQGFLSRLVQLLFQGDAELGAHQGSGIKVELTVDVGNDAQHQELLEDLGSRLADTLGQNKTAYLK